MSTGNVGTFKCYFDASFTPTLSSCAFVVESEMGVQHSFSCCKVLSTSQTAERHALNLLLHHIRAHIAPGSIIKIFGDCKIVIDKMNAQQEELTGNKTRKTLNKMRRQYQISLTFIPRTHNKMTHKLAKDALRPHSLQGQSLMFKKYDFTNSKHMALEDIIIPAYITKNPQPEKYAKRLEFYETHDRLYKPIHVSPDDVLVDGYISYLILKACGERTCQVIIEENFR